MAAAIIRVVFTEVDLESLAEELGVDIDTATERANEWASYVEATAQSLVNDQMASVVELNTP